MPCADRIRPGLLPFWMLNDASTVEQKLDYQRRCLAGGIKTLVMHPRPGNLIPFASVEWFAMIRRLVNEGARQGMSIWLYDEDPYPSGAAGGLVMAERPDLRARSIGCVRKPDGLAPGQLWFISRSRVLWAGLVPERKPLPAVDLTASVGPLRADWFSTEWDSRYYYNETPLFPCVRGNAIRMFFAMRVPEIPKGFRLIALTEDYVGLEGPWCSLPDLLHRDAFETYARLGLDPYRACVGEHFGAAVPGIFTDEAKPFGSVPFTAELFDDFRARYGYDLRPRLYQLYGEPLGEAYVRVRLDYRRWVSERFLDIFVKPYRRWCDANGLLLVGHFSPEDDPLMETFTLGHTMPIMKAMTVPGVDVIVPAVGDAKSPTLNQGSLRAGSLKSQTGRRYASSESQALGDWVVVSRKTRQIYAWQKVLGIDRFFTHGFYNSAEGVLNLEAPPEYGPNSSLFRGTCAVNAWLERLDPVVDGARETADVAILDSLETFWAWGPGMNEEPLALRRRSIWRCILACLQAQVGVHLLDAPDAATAEVEPGALRVGSRSYRTVLVPAIDILDRAAFARLAEAAAAGVRVVWFGGGPGTLADAACGLSEAAPAPGTVVRAAWPSRAWCVRELPRQVLLGGASAHECYVRRFTSEDGRDRLLAVNVADEPRTFALGAEGGGWQPVPGMADGETAPKGGALAWRVPGGGVGLFELSPVAPEAAPRAAKPESRPLRGAVSFERLGANILRLDACVAVRRGLKPVPLRYPRPYWQVFDDYRVQEPFGGFDGDVPVESTVPDADLRYRFEIRCRGRAPAATLVLEPRAARGVCRAVVNGRAVGPWRAFPLETIEPVRLRLRGLRPGPNRVEIEFKARSGMDGLQCPLFVEGDFDVALEARGPVVAVRAGLPVSPRGWVEMGLPHYMGDGVYRWTERLSEAEAARLTALELDGVVDSAQLSVNGVDRGTCAWPPWRWALSGLRAGDNVFELTVSSTAGNKLSLVYPRQAQGWLGAGRLI